MASSAPRPAKATAVRLSFSVPAMTQPVTMSAKATADDHSSRARRPIDASAARAARGASGVVATPGGNRPTDHEREQQDRGERRNRRGRRATTEIDRHAELLRDLDPDRIDRCRREPEGRGDGEARHAAEHEVAAEATSLGSSGFDPAPGQGQHHREKHAAARGVARERGRDDGVGEDDAVGESERRAAEGAHDDAG